jgi:hypothetical protein
MAKIRYYKNEPHYREKDFEYASPAEIADAIVLWRDDEFQFSGAAYDLLNAMEPRLRELGEQQRRRLAEPKDYPGDKF